MTSVVNGTRFVSNVAIGTSPLTVTSTTLCTNLNADLLDGYNTALTATANTVAVRDTNASLTANIFIGNLTGTAANAKYADLAENFRSDMLYTVGTVLMLGGNAEVTIAERDSTALVGTVSDKPGFLMNSELDGEYVLAVAYVGRVPCRVEGPINRGDLLVVGNNAGVAISSISTTDLFGKVVGKALESSDGTKELIEIVVGRL